MEYRGFCGGFYRSQAVTADCERTVNFIPERMESQGATTRVALYPTPGLERIVNTNATNGRAHIFVGGQEFAVVGSSFFEIDEGGTVTFRGTVAVDANPATISSNGDGGDQIFITSGGNGYIWAIGPATFTQIAALNGIATMGDALDGYFLNLDAATGTFYISDLLDGTSWNTGTQFAQRNDSPDPWIAMKVKGRYVYLIGDQTGSIWYNSGESPFPFAPHPSGSFEYGTAAAFSLRVGGGSIFWLGQSKDGGGMVMRATDFSPEAVSSYAVQYAINGYETVSDAVGDCYDDSGHTFYVLSFPAANVTWCYDVQMQMWHERGTWDPASLIGAYSVWRPRFHAYAFGEHRWLHATGTGLYRMDRTLFDDVDDLIIRRERIGPEISSENKRLGFNSFQVDVQPGLGTSGQGENPQVMMQFSDDSGQTWSTERMGSAGPQGEYTRRVIWHRLGQSRRRVFRVVMTDPVPWRITAAYVETTPSTAFQQRGAA